MNLKKLNKKLDKPTYFLGLAALIVFIPMFGYLIGWAVTDTSQLSQDINLIQEASADQLIEGVKYKVLIEESVGTTDQLR